MPRFKTNKLAKIARIILVVYAISFTGVMVLAITVGPFKDSSVTLWVKLRSLETEFRESQKKKKSWIGERERLLMTIKSLRADWVTQQETIRVLREVVKNPGISQKLVETNQLVNKLNNERSVLIVKVNELQKKLLQLADKQKKGAKE